MKNWLWYAKNTIDEMIKEQKETKHVIKLYKRNPLYLFYKLRTRIDKPMFNKGKNL